MRNRAVLFLCLLLLTLPVVMPSEAADGGDFVIFRAKLAPYYIENQSVQVQVYALVFRDNKPTSESATIHIEIEGVNVEYSYKTSFQVNGGKITTQFLPALQEGHYKATLYAQKDSIKSETVVQDFGVTKPPVPYDCHFSQDGSKVYFTSHQLDQDGHLDRNFTFRLEIYYYRHGAGEAKVMTVSNITNTTITINPEWKHGIVYVDVIDRWGWRNSATMDLSNMQFSGIPLSYDYEYTQREPYKSHNLTNFILAGFALIILFLIATYIYNERRGEYD